MNNIAKAIQQARGILLYQNVDLDTRFEVFESKLSGLAHSFLRGGQPVKGQIGQMVVSGEVVRLHVKSGKVPCLYFILN